MAGTRWASLSTGNLARASDMNANLAWMEGALAPMNGGSTTTGVHDIGTTTALWRHGYFSGQIVVASISATTINVGTIAIATAAPSIPTANVLYRDNIAKAWINFAATGVGDSIRDDFNVASITRIGEGNYRLTFAVAMANSSWALGGGSIDPGVTHLNGVQPEILTTTFAEIKTITPANALADGAQTHVLFFGDQ